MINFIELPLRAGCLLLCLTNRLALGTICKRGRTTGYLYDDNLYWLREISRLRISVLGEIWYSFVVQIRPRVPIASTQTVDLSQTPPARVTSVPVSTRLSRHSQLQLQLEKKMPNKLRTVPECISSRAIPICIFSYQVHGNRICILVRKIR